MNNILAVALGSSVYLWNAETGSIDHLLELEGADYVCSLSWIEEGNLIAVGTSLGNVQVSFTLRYFLNLFYSVVISLLRLYIQLWDVSQTKRLRVMGGHSVRVSSLSWNTYIISSGSRTGQIIHHDVRNREHLVATLNSHSHEVELFLHKNYGLLFWTISSN